MSKQGLGFRWQPPDGQCGKSPSWKDRYRQRCMDKLRDNRFKLLLSRRQPSSLSGDADGVAIGGGEETVATDDDGIVIDCGESRPYRKEKMMKDVQAMMSAEWEMIQKEDASRKGIKPVDIPAPSVDEMIELMEDILDELRIEKLRQSNEADVCEEYAKQEDEELCQAFHRLNAVEVVCPVCQKESLQEGAGSIHCKCGLYINTEQDSISLKYVSDSLHSGIEQHEAECELKPCFSQMEGFGITTLVMTCQECDFHFIVV